jgi:hypothetical protein
MAVTSASKATAFCPAGLAKAQSCPTLGAFFFQRLNLLSQFFKRQHNLAPHNGECFHWVF